MGSDPCCRAADSKQFEGLQRWKMRLCIAGDWKWNNESLNQLMFRPKKWQTFPCLIFLTLIRWKSQGFGLLVTLAHPHHDASRNREFPTPLHLGYLGRKGHWHCCFGNNYVSTPASACFVYSKHFRIDLHIFFRILVKFTGKLSKPWIALLNEMCSVLYVEDEENVTASSCH